MPLHSIRYPNELHGVCVCIYILNYLEYSMNTLLVYTMYSCFLAFDPDTSHVHRPIPNHVESIVSDFEV